jgi:thiol-disulfide isomerase/thioredoxin
MVSNVRKHRARQRQKLTVLLAGGAVLVLGVAAYLVMTSISGVGRSASPAGEVAPTVSLISLDGSAVTVPDSSRQATILFSMAYWCGSCIPEGRALARLGREYGDTVRIVAVDIDPSSTPELLQDWIDYVGENNLTWTFDSDGNFMRRYGIRALDTTIILDGQGREVYRDAYPTTYEVLHSQLEGIVNP